MKFLISPHIPKNEKRLLEKLLKETNSIYSFDFEDLLDLSEEEKRVFENYVKRKEFGVDFGDFFRKAQDMYQFKITSTILDGDKNEKNADYILPRRLLEEELEERLRDEKAGLINLFTDPKRRFSFDEIYMRQTMDWAQRTTCLRRGVGAIIAKDNVLISQGYNGAPKDTKDCKYDLGFCLREKKNIPSGMQHEKCRAVHAEQNALINARNNGGNIQGAIIYLQLQPCVICTKEIIQNGISEVIFRNPYDDELSLKLLEESPVKLTYFSGVTPMGYKKIEKIN